MAAAAVNCQRLDIKQHTGIREVGECSTEGLFDTQMNCNLGEGHRLHSSQKRLERTFEQGTRRHRSSLRGRPYRGRARTLQHNAIKPLQYLSEQAPKVSQDAPLQSYGLHSAGPSSQLHPPNASTIPS